MLGGGVGVFVMGEVWEGGCWGGGGGIVFFFFRQKTAYEIHR